MPCPSVRTVVHLLSSFGIGGQERVALDLARGQLGAGWRALAVSLAPEPDGPLARDFLLAGVGTRTVPKRGGVDLTLVPRLARLLRAEGATILHTHNPQPLLYGAPAARLAGIPVVHTKHGRNPDTPRRMAARRAAARLVGAYVAVSETTADAARADSEVSPSRLRTIANGIDLDRFHPDAQARGEIRQELGLSGEAWLFGTVGRLSPEKNHQLLVTAFAALEADDAHLVIVGGGPERAALATLVQRLRASDRIHLLGARSDVPRILAALDVFVLSSTTEGLPLVLPEAMATGLPVLSTAVGGIPAVIDEARTGHLVPSGDVEALRCALESLRRGRPRARAMGAAARQVALERYSDRRMVREYLALYDVVAPDGHG